MTSWRDCDDIPLPPPPQKGRAPWSDSFHPCRSIRGELEEWPEVESATSPVKLLLTDCGLFTCSSRDHLDIMSAMLTPSLTPESTGIVLWLIDAQNCRTAEERASYWTGPGEDVDYLRRRYPGLQHVRLMMCPMHMWAGSGKRPSPLKRSVDINHFALPLGKLRPAEISAESRDYVEVNLSDLSTMLCTTRIIYGVGGNPWFLRWAFESDAGQLVLQKIQSGDVLYIGMSAGMMAMSRWIGRTTGDSKYYDPTMRREGDANSIDVSGGDDTGLAVLPVNCCFRPHCKVEEENLKHRMDQVTNFSYDHPDVNTTVIFTRAEGDDGRPWAGDAVAYYGGRFHWLDMDSPGTASISIRSRDDRSCGCEHIGCMVN